MQTFPLAPQELLQRQCGGFLARMAKFRELVPVNHFEEVRDDIEKALLVSIKNGPAQLYLLILMPIQRSVEL